MLNVRKGPVISCREFFRTTSGEFILKKFVSFFSNGIVDVGTSVSEEAVLSPIVLLFHLVLFLR